MGDKKIAIVDVDNTLWDFGTVFYEKIKKLVPDIKPMREWAWAYPEQVIGRERMYEIIDAIHEMQDTQLPFPEAKDFLSCLSDMGLFIIIASHRNKKHEWALESFLVSHGLVHDMVYTSYDKSKLFRIADILVDDCPSTIKKARKRGMIVTSIRQPYLSSEDCVLHDNLLPIVDYIQDMLKRKGI
jgi:beta-phosphoglucomutase-like phosphatase (HAD superfamily)